MTTRRLGLKVKVTDQGQCRHGDVVGLTSILNRGQFSSVTRSHHESYVDDDEQCNIPAFSFIYIWLVG